MEPKIRPGKIETEIVKSDITVVGAGLAGVCAAITAAREGCRVALVGDRPVLGGNSSSEMRMWTRGATGGGNYFAEEMGILGELKLENLYRNPEGNALLWDELLLDFVLQEKNITLFLNTSALQVEKGRRGIDPAVISRVIAYQQASERHFSFESRVFVDSTGDGTVGYLAGAEYRRGRESSKEFDEPYAPEEADDTVLGSSIFFQTKETKKTVRFVPPSFAHPREEIEKLLNRGGRIVNERMSGTDYWWLEYGGTLDTIKENQAIALELKRVTLGVWDYIKNSGKYKADRLTLEWIGSLASKRESRRFMGDYLLTQKDILENRRFEDAVCYGGWFLDSHPPEGIYSEEEFCIQVPTTVYDIPIRCLYSRNVGNLLLAGRDISVTHAALTSTRVMDTCAMTGQASGMIAAFMVREGLGGRALYEQRRKEIRQSLLAGDMMIIGCRNEDPRDLALQARIEASSRRIPRADSTGGTVALEEDVFILFPWKTGMGDLRLLLDVREDTRLEYELCRCSRPEGFRRGEKVKEGSLAVTRDPEASVSFPLGISETGSYHLVLRKNPGVQLRYSQQSCTGFLAGELNGKQTFTPCFDFAPGFRSPGSESAGSDLYSEQNLISGFNRPYLLPNLWISERIRGGEKEWVRLNWEKPVSVQEVRLYFNPDLSKELTNIHGETWSEHHGFVAREGMPPELVRHYTISAGLESGWKDLLEVKENRKRMAVHRIGPVKAGSLKVTFEDTYGSPYIEVFEIKVT